MSLWNTILTNGPYLATVILGGLALLSICIFVHELGHLLGGKMVGIKAKTFSLFFGRGLIKKKIGDTTYQIGYIPLGGFCQFYGEDPSEERTGASYEFLSAHPLRRIVTVAMGPLFNLLFGILIFFIMNTVGYQKESNRVYIPEDMSFGSGMSAAYQQGIRSGDTIVSINDRGISNFTDISKSVFFSEGKPLSVTYERGSERKTVTVTPKKGEKIFQMGVEPFPRAAVVADLSDTVPVARNAGLRMLDEIRAVNGTPVASSQELVRAIHGNAGKQTVLTVVRKGKEFTATVVPQSVEFFQWNEIDETGARGPDMPVPAEVLWKLMAKKQIQVNGAFVPDLKAMDALVAANKGKPVTISLMGKSLKAEIGFSTRGIIGISPANSPAMTTVIYTPGRAFVQALIEPYEFIVMNVKGLGMIFSGKLGVRENVSGPIRIVKIAGDVLFEKGISAFVILMAQISVILMFMNLLPIPVVDGSHIVFFFIEFVRGKRLSDKVMERIQMVGVALLAVLFIFIIANDLWMVTLHKLFQ